MKKIELTDKEYNTLNDILHELAHYSKKGGTYFYAIGTYHILSQQEFNELYELWLKIARARYKSTNDF